MLEISDSICIFLLNYTKKHLIMKKFLAILKERILSGH